MKAHSPAVRLTRFLISFRDWQTRETEDIVGLRDSKDCPPLTIRTGRAGLWLLSHNNDFISALVSTEVIVLMFVLAISCRSNVHGRWSEKPVAGCTGFGRLPGTMIGQVDRPDQHNHS